MPARWAAQVKLPCGSERYFRFRVLTLRTDTFRRNVSRAQMIR
jgi:hypothetical protein